MNEDNAVVITEKESEAKTTKILFHIFRTSKITKIKCFFISVFSHVRFSQQVDSTELIRYTRVDFLATKRSHNDDFEKIGTTLTKVLAVYWMRRRS